MIRFTLKAMIESLLQDVRYAIKQLVRTPIFTAAAAATLAIGIGATTAIFSTVNATLLRSLPFPRSEELIAIRTRYTDGKVTTGMVAPVELNRLNSGGASIVRAAGVSMQPFDGTLVRDNVPPVHVVANGVTEGFFELLGLPIALGRGLVREDHVAAPNAPLRVILSHRMWRSVFDSDSAVLGTRLRLAENPKLETTVVGVAARDVDFPRGTDFWFGAQFPSDSTFHILDGILRIRPGTPLGRLRTEMAGVMSGLAQDFPQTETAREYVVQPLVNQMVGDVRPTLLIILGATGLLLMLAATNVANLLLARGTARSREIAVRTAMGASQGRIVRQLLTESLVLATVGALGGLGLGYAGVRLLLVLGASRLPRLESVPFDGRVLLFALVMLVVSGLAVGLAPAWRLATTELRTLINESGRTASGGRTTARLMRMMVVAEITLAITLVAGAGWLVQSFSRLRMTDPGFVASGRLVADVRAARSFGSPEEASAWWRALLERMRSVGGIEKIGGASTFPFRADRDGTLLVEFQGERMEPGRTHGGRARFVTPGFFDAMGISMAAGRGFTDDDRATTMPVAVVNLAFARRYLGDRDPIGVRFTFGYPTPDPKTLRTIVGVVRDVRYKSLAEEAEPAFYLPAWQVPFNPLRQAVVVSMRGADPIAFVPALRSAMSSFDAQLAVEFDPATRIIDETLSRQQLGMTLMLVFGATALTLAAVGIWGVVAYTSAERRGEVATRIALGATANDVFTLMMRQGGRLTLVGTVAGLIVAYTAGRVVAGSVYAMRASDPMILVTAAAVVIVITLISTAIPAAAAARVDPVVALRSE
jgi:putative ABC transport system permease protein